MAEILRVRKEIDEIGKAKVTWFEFTEDFKELAESVRPRGNNQ